MEGVRFTGAEGGARLASTARSRNTLAALSREHAAFVAHKLLQENAYKIRGPLSDGRQRSVLVTRGSRVACVAYELNILTELSVASASQHNQVDNWEAEMEAKEVLVATSVVVRRLLDDRVLDMGLINVLIIDSCHLIHTDEHLKAIMAIHSKQATPDHPRILALTYPLFSQKSKEIQPIIEQTPSKDETAVEPNKLSPSEDESLKETEQCNIVSKDISNEDILRIEDIITDSDTTNIIVFKENAIFTNKAKIIELDDNDIQSNAAIESSNIINLEEDVRSNKCEMNLIEQIKHDNNIDSFNQTLISQIEDLKFDHNEEISEKSPIAISSNIEVKEFKNTASNETESQGKSEVINIETQSQIELISHEELLTTSDIESPLTETDSNESEIVRELNTENNYTEIIKGEKTKKDKAEQNKTNEDTKDATLNKPVDLQENDDFLLYEKLEWKIEELESKLCCTADLAEDIDGVKRLSATVAEPRELIVQYGERADDTRLPESYVELEQYMRDTVSDVLEFIHQHRYDPTEIYGEDAFCEELKDIPDPTLDPKEVFNQFLYVLDELGPYGADKAALSLLGKLEKLRVKVPYERHFLLLCMSTTVFLKIRCVAELVFEKCESDWIKIQRFSTPKIHRLAEILMHFKPPHDAKIPKNSPAYRNKEKTIEEGSTPTTDESVTMTLDTTKMLNDIEECDFVSLQNKLADKVNTIEANLSEIHDIPTSEHVKDSAKPLNEKSGKPNEEKSNEVTIIKQPMSVKAMGPPRRLGSRNRGRGRVPRHNHAARALQMLQNPDALCGIVFMKDPLMARVLFMIVMEMSRNHPTLSYLCPQYSGEERPADPVRETKELEKQRRKQEEVLKKFRMHECNLLFATSALEEGIDLPRCNLVLRWDPPVSYRSFSLCRSRARAPRSACVLFSEANVDTCTALLRHIATYRELDQILSRKCGCGVQDEPPQTEEEHACLYTKIIKPYTPTQPCNTEIHRQNTSSNCTDNDIEKHRQNDNKIYEKATETNNHRLSTDVGQGNFVEINGPENLSHNEDSSPVDVINVIEKHANGNIETIDNKSDNKERGTRDGNDRFDNNDVNSEILYKTSDVFVNKVDKGSEKASEEIASVDLSTAISLINRYCGKLPSDTFTRLAPQWWMEEVFIPTNPSTNTKNLSTNASTLHGNLSTNPTTGCTTRTQDSGMSTDRPTDLKLQKAYICTLRLPLNCPVKYNIVGHPMPTRVLARRMVALQACRILHRSGELDNQLMPIGKENFKTEVEYAPAPPGDEQPTCAEPAELARPGTTKRRQYYFKRTAWSFTDCQPIQDASDSNIDSSKPTLEQSKPCHAQGSAEATWNKDDTTSDEKRNMLYAVVSRLCCALPERYNTRGRKLHVPQTARQGLGILTSRQIKKIPAFPVYTRSGEVRVSVEYVADADVRVSPRRARLVRRFMKFVFADVLRVRRRGMHLSTDGRHNNYYVVPTCRSIGADGSEKIDIDWEFLELIYTHTEQKNNEMERQVAWARDDRADTAGETSKKSDLQIQSNNEEGRKNESTEDSKKENTENTKKDITEGNKKKETEDSGLDTTERNKKEGSEHSNAESTEGGKKEDTEHGKTDSAEGNKKTSEKKELQNPLLKPGEKFLFDSDKYKEAVVTPWYRNQDQPQFFLVAEICWKLTPESAFPSATHTTFRHYYTRKYGVKLTQVDQPLLDVDHTSARLNLLTPRYVNRKGVALPVSSERTRRAKRDRLDQKQILVPELCRVHPFAAPLWFATVALPCVLYRINALLIADEIRRSVAIDVGLGSADIDETTRPGFQWPPLDFGWSLAEVLSVDEAKAELKREDSLEQEKETAKEEGGVVDEGQGEARQKTVNEILQEKEEVESGFEIGTWSNDMASSVPDDYDELFDPLPPNLTFCTSASGGSNWPDTFERGATMAPRANVARAFSMADSDCSYMSSDLDSDDSSLVSDSTDEDTSGFGCPQHTSARLGVRIEYKTPHEAEAFELKTEKKGVSAPQPDDADDARDRAAADTALNEGTAPLQHILKFKRSIEEHHKDILEKGLLIKDVDPIISVLPPVKDVTAYSNLSPKSLEKLRKDSNIPNKLPLIDYKTSNPISNITNALSNLELNKNTKELIKEIFPYDTINENVIENGQISIEVIERSKRILLERLKESMTAEEVKNKNFFSMMDVDMDSPNYVNEKVANVGFDDVDTYIKKTKTIRTEEIKPHAEDVKGENGKKKREFDFDYQPKLDGHPGPSPSVILQALTMSNANDGINLERLETIGDSFLKFAITAYLYCAHPTVHEGKLSHMRSKQVSNLNLYRLGRSRRLGARMIASKFEPHDNWLPPCHRAPATVPAPDRPTCARDALYWRDRSPPERESGVAGRERDGCFIPYNLITQHSIPDKSVADCVEALIGAYLIECGPRGALLFMSWLGIKVLPRYEVPLDDSPELEAMEKKMKEQRTSSTPPRPSSAASSSSSYAEVEAPEDPCEDSGEESEEPQDWSWRSRGVGTLTPYRNTDGHWMQPVFGELKAPPSPLLRYIDNPDGELEQMLSGYDALERTLRYRFNDRSLLLQALTHASHHLNRLTDCYQRLEFLGDAILDYLITRHLYEDERRHSPGALTDLRSALVNNTIFATLAVRHGFHKYFRHMSPGLNEVLTRYVKIQEENGHSISEEHYLIQEDEMEQAEDVEVPKALGDLFESVAGAIFLDSGMSLGAVWRSYVGLMGAELEAFSAAAPKSPVRELLEAEPDTAKFGKPERLADGRRVRVCVEVFGRGTFKGVGRNYRIAKGTAARCALRHLKKAYRNN